MKKDQNVVQTENRKPLKLAKSTLKNLTVKSGVKAGSELSGRACLTPHHRCVDNA